MAQKTKKTVALDRLAKKLVGTNGTRVPLVQLFNDFVMTDQLPNGGNTMFMVDAQNGSSESWLVFATGN